MEIEKPKQNSFDKFILLQVNIFFNSLNIIPDTSTFIKILELFKEEEFIPNTILELGPEGAKPRLNMSSKDTRWNISFLQNYISLKYVCGPKDDNDNTLKLFLPQSEKIAGKIFKYIGQKSTRLALVFHAMLNEMTKEELESCYRKLFNPLPLYNDNAPFEWNNRSVSQVAISFENVSEKLNIITEIKRNQGQLLSNKDILEFDRIFLQYEINTLSENRETRFDIMHYTPFINVAKDNYLNILNDIESVIYG